MAGATRRSSGIDPSTPETRRDALAALQLWQTFEYLSPQNPPKPELGMGTCIWALNSSADGDEEMPWKSPAKIEALGRLFKSKRRYLLFGGVIEGKELVETARSLLDAPPLDFTEQRAPASAASFVIPIDEHGHVSGEVFVSTVPWAIACIKAAQDKPGLFDFSGFFGEEGVQQRIKDAVEALLKQRQLIEDESTEDQTTSQSSADEGGGDSEDGSPQATSPVAEIAGHTSASAKKRTLDAADVRAVADEVFAICGWRPAIDASWIIQTLRAPTKNPQKAPDDPLNSFYAEELEKIQGEYLAGRSGKVLSQFLETPVHPERCNLESTRDHLIGGVHPSLTPMACWPGKYPLVTAQQFAINTIMRELQTGGLFSVNGPPGTGKTTMLKDLLAAIVLQRADALASFDAPMDAFPGKLTIERHGYPVWKIHDQLRDFGIVVACANNGAAENISKELPGLAAIDPAMAIDYFSEVADSIGLPKDKKQREHMRWGLVSAALGKQENRFAFATDFWDSRLDPSKDKRSTKKTAQEADTAPAPKPDPMRPFTLRDWVTEFGPQVPAWNEAKQRYADAKERASVALQRAGTLASQLRAVERLAEQIKELTDQHARLSAEHASLKRQEGAAHALASDAQHRMEQADTIAKALHMLQQHQVDLEHAQNELTTLQQRKPRASIAELDEKIARAERARLRVREDWDAHDKAKPGLVASLFYRAGKQQWAARNELLLSELDAKRRQLETLEQDKEGAVRWQHDIAGIEQKLQALHGLKQSAHTTLKVLGINDALSLQEANTQSQAAKQNFQLCRSALLDLQKKTKHLAQEIQANATTLDRKKETFDQYEASLRAAGLRGRRGADWRLQDATREDFHRASPYYEEETFKARRDLFAAAMDLHKAFIVHSWNRLKTTLFAAVAMLQGKIHPNQIHGGPMPLWDALFLVVPLVSTTFASFPRLFRGVGKEQLAWVLIDEAGQASPQYCVGALWRAKRAVIVGDPLQLEPVVGVPEELIEPLRECCGTRQRYVPPRASAQTMADLSNRYGMYLHEDDPDNRIWLGAPLVVHRRCLDPMFGIANAIAYEDKMVYGTGEEEPRSDAPVSHWLDLPAEGNEAHWIPAQGRRAVQIVKELVGHQLRDKEGKLRAFVITPFKKVAENMKDLLAGEFGRADGWQMCGTVHTFQGKEADYVVFLLGGDPRKPAVISSFAGKNPNLVNVAVTRAKKRLYVLGKRSFWTGRGDTNGYYGHMAEVLDRHQAITKVDSTSITDIGPGKR